ncbi:MAG: histidine phosphatase family protein [Planctomycetes bacterium]|nr:histidine phosphatase family protein [Planctomycetota bacterium]
MPTYLLLRHADAGDRADWHGDDKQRPLTDKGRKQAQKMAKLLKKHEIDEVRSSPAARCIQTAEPVAAEMGLRVVSDEGLFEGSAIKLGKAKGTYLICAHGDNIPETLDRLGVKWEKCAKGSCWRLKISDKGEVNEAEYIPPQA